MKALPLRWNRADRSYGNLVVATSRSIRPSRLWDLLSAAGRDSVVVGSQGPIRHPRSKARW
jgi:predicted AlkP superfamily phosphohydrolase/phosphomutase